MFLKDWPHYDYLAGKKITLVNAQEKTTGVAVGINEQGHLVLDVEGVEKAFATGSVLSPPFVIEGPSV